jgi:phage-related minor tail protein
MATMSPQEVTRRLIVVAETQGVNLAKYFENLEKAASSSGASIKTSERQFKAWERTVSPTAKALQDLGTAARRSFGALAAGVVDAERVERAFAAAVEKTNTALANARAAADQAAEARKRQSEAEERDLQQLLQRYDKRAAAIAKRDKIKEDVGRLTSAGKMSPQRASSIKMDADKEFRDFLSSGVTAEAKRLDDLRAKYSPLYKVQREYLGDLKDIKDAHRAGAISAHEYSNAIAKTKAEFTRVVTQEIQGGRIDALGRKPGERLALHQARNLGFQMNDVLTGLMSGQSPAMIAAQQGGQIYQILSDGPGGAAGGAKRLLSYIGEIVTVGRVATLGIAAFGFAAFKAFDDAVERAIALQQALNGIGALSGQTVGGLQGIARSSAGRGGVSIARAESFAGGYANAGLQGAQIADLTGSTRNFAKAFGIDIDAAGKELAQAFRDPAKGAEELNRRFGTFSDATLEAIRRAQESGDANRAQSLLLRSYNDAMAQVTVRTNALSDAFEKTKTVFSDLWTRAGQALAGPTAQEALDNALSAPRSRGRAVTRSQMLSRTRRGIDPDAQFEQADVARQNTVIEAWRRAMEESARAILRQGNVERAQLSRTAGGYAREVTPWEENAKRFEDRIRALGEALRAGALTGAEADRAREAIERYGSSLRMTLNPMQQIQLQSALQIQQTLAMTAAQRAAVSAQQAYTQAISEGKTATEATAAAEAAVNQARADGLRQVMEAQRDAKNRLELAGLLPGERGAVEIQQRMRELQRQTDVGASRDLPAVFVPFRLGLDLATAALTNFTAAVTGAAGGNAPGRQAAIPEDQWRARSTNRVDQGAPIAPAGPFGRLNTFEGYSLRETPAIGSLQQVIDDMVRRANGGAPRAGNDNVPAYRPAQTPAGGIAVDPAEARRRIGSIGVDLHAADQMEKYTRIVKQSEQDIQLQNRALDSQIFNFGRSQEEVAAAARQQEMLNQAQRDGLQVTPAIGAAMAKAANDAGTLAKRTADFKDSLQTLNDIRGGISDAFSSFASGMARGEGFAKSMQSAVNSLTNSLIKMSTNMLMRGLFGDSNFSGGLLSDFAKMLVPSANGNVFSNGNVVPFARGGIVSQPTIFPMAKGAGLMGEAGPEGILPLRRNNRGELGVMAGGAGGGGDSGLNVVVNNYGKDEVSVTESRGPDGRRMLEIMVQEQVAQTIANGGADSALRGRSGIMPRKVING